MVLATAGQVSRRTVSMPLASKPAAACTHDTCSCASATFSHPKCLQGHCVQPTLPPAAHSYLSNRCVLLIVWSRTFKQPAVQALCTSISMACFRLMHKASTRQAVTTAQ